MAVVRGANLCMPDESFWFLLLGGALSVLGALGGILSERRRLSFVIRDQAARNSEMGRRLTAAQESFEKAEAEKDHLSTFLVVLPDVVRRLNAERSKRNIPSLLQSSLDHIFDPDQILVFLARARGELVLAAGKGVPPGLEAGFTIPFGQGQIGLAARHQKVMDHDDIVSESMQHRAAALGDHPGFKLDLIAPITYGDALNSSPSSVTPAGVTLGVISVGGIGRRLRDQKRMIKLVADLGSLALTNADLYNRLQTMANRDSLTHLATKRYLNEKLGDHVVRAQQTHKPLSVAIFDIDHFKKLNDTYGHLAGDQVLRAVARILRSQLRSEDIPARYGGEEFVIVLPDTPKEEAMKLAEKIRRAIEAHSFPGAFGDAGEAGRVTISGGVAASEIDGLSSNEILGAADQALYLAKEQGRNRVVAFRSRYLSEEQEATTL